MTELCVSHLVTHGCHGIIEILASEHNNSLRCFTLYFRFAIAIVSLCTEEKITLTPFNDKLTIKNSGQ